MRGRTRYCVPWKGEQGGLGLCSLVKGAERTWFLFPGKGSREDLDLCFL